MSGSRERGRERPEVELEREGRRWRALEAWRARSGHGLAYFVPLDEGDPLEADAEDRRALLDPDRRLPKMRPAELEALWARAVPLTGTERRLAAPDGELWLVQCVGPVWAEGDVAEGATGLLATRLTAAPERRRLSGARLSELTGEELLGSGRPPE